MKLTVTKSRTKIGDNVQIVFIFSGNSNYADYYAYSLTTAIEKFLQWKEISCSKISIKEKEDGNIIVTFPAGEKTFYSSEWKKECPAVLAAYVVSIGDRIIEILRSTHDLFQQEFSVEF